MTKTNPRMLSPAALAKEARLERDQHRVAEVDYSEDTMTCLCGWTGEALDIKVFRDHRRDAAKALATVGSG